MTQAVVILLAVSVALVVIFCAALLVVAATVVLAGGAYVWGFAIAAAHRAALHGVQAASTINSVRETNEAVDEAKERFGLKSARAPSEQELLEMVLAERGSANGQAQEEYTTLGNEHIPETSPTSVGGDGDMFATGYEQ